MQIKYLPVEAEGVGDYITGQQSSFKAKRRHLKGDH